MKNIYLPGLNGLRAIAACAVILSHINLNLPKFGLPRVDALQLASFGVTIFFTLSGFLITFLLIREKEKKHDVDVRKFYIRRILRIWPLYYLFIGIVLVHHTIHDYSFDKLNLLYYLFFTPNVPFVAGGTINLLVHYWSLGVEEQFYAFWPWVVKKLRKIEIFLLLFVPSFILLKLAAKFLDPSNISYAFLHYTRFGCMAIGALGAWYYIRGHRLMPVVYSRFLQLLPVGIFALIVFNKFHIASIIDHEVVGVLTVVVILNQISNPKPLFSLEKNAFNYLGKISFGLYVYNPWIIDITADLLAPINQLPVLLRYGILYSVIPVAVIAVSHISFYFFESWFLKLKDDFSVIRSSSSKTTQV